MISPKRSYQSTCASYHAPILKTLKYPPNPASDIRPDPHKHSQTLVIAHMTTPVPVARPPSCKSQTIPQILHQTMSPKRINTHKLSYNSRHRSHDRTCASGKAAILQILNNPANPASDNESETHKHSQTLANSRTTLVIARMTTPVPVARPPSCKSQTIPQILLQTMSPKRINTRKYSQTLVQRSSSLA